MLIDDKAPELTCADLFCGAGGFSEGFRQAGFRVTKALDLWAPAIKTHELNHPETLALREDILECPPEAIGGVDVLIGSPPCTEFSFANRGGGGDIEEGMRLVYRFLRFVYELQPRWWVMENVPRVLHFLPAEVPLRKLGICKRGVLPIPKRVVLTSAEYGAPQKRARAFSGHFPVPAATFSEIATSATKRWRTLRDVVEALPDPLRPAPASARDPVYGFDLPTEHLTDHFSPDLVLTDEEVRENRKAKEDHSWYGRMSFPDELDRPARTVMATNLRVSRETTVIAADGERYRRLSVREASSVQGFPITYQWVGSTSSTKYKLVGNAVAPPVAHAIACAILAEAQRESPSRPYVLEHVTVRAPDAHARERRHQLPLTRRFREHIPGSKVPGYRVDLDNQGFPPAKHPVGWRTVLYRGGGKALRRELVSLELALSWLDFTMADEQGKREFLQAVRTRFAHRVPSATRLQLIRSERASGPVTPYTLLEDIAGLVARFFNGVPAVESLDARRDPDFVPTRIAATLVATSYVCALANDHPRRPRVALPKRPRGVSADTKSRKRQSGRRS
ncbi:MAG: DNA cytosine methyltransferase [Chloroflexota bacterium]|nr:DNA cytosine methyltransferase [Chloroflexota bacterium]